MKKTQADYGHLLLLLGWVVYFLLYFLTERLIPPEKCHLIHVSLDDRIPFCEQFVFFYAGWYFLILGSILYFLRHSVNSFIHLQSYIIIVQLLATAIYIIYPSRLELRPEAFSEKNIWTGILSWIYWMDTPTGVCPSLHVAISLAIASTWLREKLVKQWIRGLIMLFCLGVCLSVVFVKQHSVLDVFAAIPLCLLAEWFVFFRRS